MNLAGIGRRSGHPFSRTGRESGSRKFVCDDKQIICDRKRNRVSPRVQKQLAKNVFRIIKNVVTVAIYFKN